MRILRRDAERIGFPKSFTIYDADDQLRVIKQIYKELLIDDKFLPPKSAIARISGYKDKLLSAADVAAEAPSDTKARAGQQNLHGLRRAAQKSRGHGFRRPDLLHPCRCSKTTPKRGNTTRTSSATSWWTNTRTRSIAQFHLVRLLAGGTNNVCVVGDDDQSIYKFAARPIENILNFEQVFRGAADHPAGAELPLDLQHPERRQQRDPEQQRPQGAKTLWTENGDGDKVHHYTASSRAGRSQPHRRSHRREPARGRAPYATTPCSTA